MERLSTGQRKALAEFFTNAAVAWLSAGIIAPLLTGRKLEEFTTFGIWGLFFACVFITISLYITKGVNA